MTKFNHVLSYMWATVLTFENRKKEEGITAIEYALMAAGMAVIIGFALFILSDKIQAIFNGIPDTGPVISDPAGG